MIPELLGPPLSCWHAAQRLSLYLEEQWGRGRRAMAGRHGLAVRHLSVHVFGSTMVHVRCSEVAFGWHVIRRLERDGWEHAPLSIELRADLLKGRAP